MKNEKKNRVPENLIEFDKILQPYKTRHKQELFEI